MMRSFTGLLCLTLSIMASPHQARAAENPTPSTHSFYVGGEKGFSNSGISVGTRIRENLNLELNHNRATSGAFHNPPEYYTTLKSSVLSARVLYFPWRQFFITGGVARQQAHAKEATKYSQNTVDYVADATTYGLDAGFGSRWQIGSQLYLGVEWFHIYRPLVVSANERGTLHEHTAKPDYQDFRLPTFQIGMSF
jgi:hypothetical protein